MRKRYPLALGVPALAAALAPTAFAQSADYNALPDPHGLVPQPGGAAAALADLDGDGILDVLGLRYEGPGAGTGSNWSFFYQPGLGDGTFGAVISNPFDLVTWDDREGEGSFWPSLALGDVDGDGDLDLFTSGPAYQEATGAPPMKLASLYYWQNVGTDAEPSFAAPVENPFGISAINTGLSREVAHPALHDLDGDGALDLVVVAPADAAVYLNSGTNPPQFTLTDTLGIPTNINEVRGVTFFDADGDENADLVLPLSDGRILCLPETGEEEGLPSFGPSGECLVQRSVQHGVSRSHTVSFGNLDADAETEMLLLYAGRTYVMQPQADGRYAPDVYDPLSFDIVAESNVVVPRARDFDRDGDVDVIVVDREGAMLPRYLENTGTSVAPAVSAPFGLTASSFSGIDFADLNGDGRFDAVSAGARFPGSLEVYYDQNESGAPDFSIMTPLASDLPAATYLPALGDLDEDGDADLVLGNPSSGELIVLRNTPDDAGLPVFATVSASGLSMVIPGASPTLHDFDGDGDADLYVGQEDGTVLLFRNDTPAGGDIAFTQISTPEGLATAGSGTVEFADFDGDGDADVIIGEALPERPGSAVASAAPTLRLLVSGTTPLPVELVSFTATLDGSNALLRWTTASETNNAGFDVEHRQGTQPFQTLGFVAGRGTTAETSTYRFDAEGLQPGTHVFRLRQIDFDGASSYSPEVELTLHADGLALTIFGNPVREAIRGTLALPHGEARLTLFDVLGRKVLVQEGVADAFSLDASGLSSGVYVLRAEAGSQTITRQIVVAR